MPSPSSNRPPNAAHHRHQPLPTSRTSPARAIPRCEGQHKSAWATRAQAARAHLGAFRPLLATVLRGRVSPRRLVEPNDGALNRASPSVDEDEAVDLGLGEEVVEEGLQPGYQRRGSERLAKELSCRDLSPRRDGPLALEL